MKIKNRFVRKGKPVFYFSVKSCCCYNAGLFSGSSCSFFNNSYNSVNGCRVSGNFFNNGSFNNFNSVNCISSNFSVLSLVAARDHRKTCDNSERQK